MRLLIPLGVALVSLALASCRPLDVRPLEGGSGAEKAGWSAGPMLDLRRPAGLDSVVAELPSHRVVYVGETHSSYAHHLLQLEVIRRIHALDPRLTIGMEMFQRPAQPALDDYIAGRIDEAQLLERSEWFDRWRFDYRLYRPILRFAREHAIPVIALNLPREITEAASKGELGALKDDQRRQIPTEIDRSDQAYEARLKEVFLQHPHADKRLFERFLDVQLLWDEGMADAVAQTLTRLPGHRIVVLAGGGHIQYRSGIPNRVERRSGAHGIAILPGDDLEPKPGIADLVFFPTPVELPPAGRLGVFLDEKAGAVLAQDLVPQGGAAQAGVVKGDRLTALDGQPLRSVAQLKALLMDKSPGDRVRLGLARADGPEQVVEVVLTPDRPPAHAGMGR